MEHELIKMPAMARERKTEYLQIRIEPSVKKAILVAADKHNKDVGPWLLWLAAKADHNVAASMGIQSITELNLTPYMQGRSSTPSDPSQQ